MLNIIKTAIAAIIALCVSCTYTYANYVNHNSIFNSESNRIKADIKGKIFEKGSNQSLGYATITILTADNKVVTGATSGDNGEFNFSALIDGNYKMLISFIGYKNLEIPLDITSKDIDLGKIEIEPDSEQLAATVVTAKVPLIEQKLDKVVMNVSESVMAKTNNGFEILRKAPGISVDSDGNILLNGQAVEVWIDDRPSRLNGTQLETLLSALDGNTIEKIEIMQHPSAKFDAAGSGGIINIKTKKNFINGFYGNVSLNYTANSYKEFHQGANGSVNLNYRGKKANTYLTYSPRYYQKRIGIGSTTLFGKDYENKQFSESLMGGNAQSHYAKLGSDLYINNKNTIGFLIGTTISKDEFNTFYSNAQTFTNNILSEKSKSKIDQADNMNSLDANLYYTRKFSDVSELTINADYNYFDIYNWSIQKNKYYNPDELKNAHSFNNDSKQYINIYSLKADYKNKFLKKGMIETGLKWTQTYTTNNMVRMDSVDKDFIVNDKLSSMFDYRENISAAYISISYQFSPKWSTMLGLRGEYTHTKGNWKSADTITTQNYFDVFPTVYLGYVPAENWRLSISYALRVQRPRFMQLNPFRVYIDANSYMEGNPNLRPQYSNEVTLSAGYKSFLNFGVLYQRSGNFISQDPTFDNNTGEKQIIWSNFGTFTLFGAHTSLSELPLVNKTLFLTANALFSNATSKSKSEDYSNNSLFYQVYGALTAVLPKEFKLELSGNYNSGLPYGYMNIESQWRMNFGVKKSFWKNKATLSLAIDDIFRTGNAKINIYENGTLIYNMNQQMFTQKIKIGLNYKFGKVQSQNRSNKRDDTSTRVGAGTEF